MRSNHLAPANMHAGPNMTPLVDVVMVILIFLMLAGNFASSDRFVASKGAAIASELPSVHPAPMIGEQKPQLRIHVQQSDSGPDVMRLSGSAAVSDSEALLTQLSERHAEFAQAGREDDVEVIICPTADTAWEPLMSAYDAALRAKFKTVRFARAGSQ